MAKGDFNTTEGSPMKQQEPADLPKDPILSKSGGKIRPFEGGMALEAPVEHRNQPQRLLEGPT